MTETPNPLGGHFARPRAAAQEPRPDYRLGDLAAGPVATVSPALPAGRP